MCRARREVLPKVKERKSNTSKITHAKSNEFSPDTTVLDEVKEIIELPEFDVATTKQEMQDNVVLPDSVKHELQLLISCIAETYRNNPFHNFEHASHVAMSVVKLLSRIVAPDNMVIDHDQSDKEIAASLHDHTYGITSDPLTQFACTFSAIIHDADHTGVANPLLAVENPDLASKYLGRSIAEQHSFDITWNLLMESRFSTLRNVLCPTVEEQNRFRQLVVNGVMATDISDKELKALRNGRWAKAFGEKIDEPIRDTVNRKATIVIEHLIQASDVSHTMQHWTIYRKWNENLFVEMMEAFKAGRTTTNPADSWYKGEIGFFDFYIIPLAKKLKECGVFGVSSGEYLKYAIENRRQWEEQGQAVVAELVQAHGATLSHVQTD